MVRKERQKLADDLPGISISRMAKPCKESESFGVATVKVKSLVEEEDVSSSTADRNSRTWDEVKTSGYQCGFPTSSRKLRRKGCCSEGRLSMLSTTTTDWTDVMFASRRHDFTRPTSSRECHVGTFSSSPLQAKESVDH